jgi:hypothetical protein
MRPFPIIALFCEDIREEKSGQDTLVGILPDNLNIVNLPGMLSKLGIYIRIQLEHEDNPQTIKIRVKGPLSQHLEIGSLDHLIGQAKSQAQEKGFPFAGLVAKSIISPFPVQELGKIEAIVEIDGTEYICGALNIIQSPMATTTTTCFSGSSLAARAGPPLRPMADAAGSTPRSSGVGS